MTDENSAAEPEVEETETVVEETQPEAVEETQPEAAEAPAPETESETEG